jgi:hypothetical protein
MKKLTGFVFRAFITSLVISVVSLFLKLASPVDSAREDMFGTISYYSFAVTIGVFAVHMLLLLIAYSQKHSKEPGKEI